jgi:hypothetical protein
VPTFAAVELHRRFVCMVALLAAGESVGQVRFQQQSAHWAVLRLEDGSWVEFLPPVDRAAAVGRTLRALTRRPGLLGRLGLAEPFGGFSLRLGPEAVIECRVERDGADYLLSVETDESAKGPGYQLLWSYLESHRELIARGTGEAGG